ncbi:hypothetical protein N657DRAFT_629496 [Parathielavia appendiculata]|uniref:Uncharacterized protein n=1 Tax=Parathielavia appendiculata TaxID=2587402 RepID=A0AAN6Z7X6_9PEZI|nr:hypothetical protein N657DRAFT_629496 [Parathielavia appendiculata]
MQFIVTKEVDWEADDEAEDPKPRRGVMKRYRFIIDFSRRSSKANGKKSKEHAAKSELSEDYVDSEDEVGDDPKPDQHLCYGCGQLRSELYHYHYPIKAGKRPRPSLCTQCRFFRNARIKNRARNGGRRRRLAESEARVDEREWCSSCGTLRSNEYHVKLLSGELPPWNEICGQCMMRVEKKNKIRRLRVYYEEMDAAEGVEAATHDPLRESLQQRRSSPYAITPTSSREEFQADSAATSPSGPTTGGSSGSSSTAPAAAQADPGSIKIHQESRKPGGQTLKPHARGKTPAPCTAAVPTTSGDTSQRQNARPGPEQHRPRYGQQEDMRKCANVPSYPPEPFTLKSGHTSRGKAQPKPEQQSQYQGQQQYHHHRAQQPPPLRPMGISDRYWASEEGKAEQTFTAGGYSFPGFATAYMFQEDEDGGAAAAPRSNGDYKDNNNSNNNTRYASSSRTFDCASRPAGCTTTATTATTTAAASSEHQHMPPSHANIAQAQVWEVDSDEAEEIEEGHVNLLAGKGKTRSMAAKKA